MNMKKYQLMTLFIIGLIIFAEVSSAKAFRPNNNSVDFSVGNSWDRRPPNDNDLSNPLILNLVSRTARIYSNTGANGKSIPVGSGVYLGKYQNQYIMMTNNHVIPDQKFCVTVDSVKFENQKNLKCGEIIFTDYKIDITVFTLQSNTNEEHLENLPPMEFETQKKYSAGQSLITAGFGSFKNNQGSITIDNSPNCILMRGSDKLLNLILNNSKTSLPGLAHACEQSEGDSGSVIIDSLTSKIVGLNFFVATERNVKVQSDSIIQNNVLNPSAEILGSISYAIPSALIKKSLDNSLVDPKQKHKDILYALLSLFD